MEQHEMICAIANAAPRRRLSWLAFAVLAMVLAWGGCGDDPVAVSSPPSSRAKAKKRNRARGGAQNAGGLQFYKKVEDFAADEKEAEQLRHVFSPSNFEPDPSGEENRDPFRSYVIQHAGLRGRGNSEGEPEPSKGCTRDKLVASNYSLRDLRLVGIVLRGTRSYALFRDSASYGHIVRKGDCLAQEKARVAAIRTGFVSLELINANQETRPGQETTIQLYPEEATLEPVR